MLLPVVAVAQPIQGLYINVGAGANFAGDLFSQSNNTKIYTTAGPVALVDLGWGFGNGLRAEVEGSYRSNGISGISTRRVDGMLLPLGDVSGNAATYAVMANVAYDIPFHVPGLPLQPYVGAGLGYGWLDLGNAQGTGFAKLTLPDNNTFGPSPVHVTFGTGGAFAYQAIGGVSMPLESVPGLSLTLEYRYFGMAAASVPVNRVAITNIQVNGATPSAQTHNNFTTANNAVLIGVRYAFGRPPAPPPPVPEAVPAAAVSRSYLVFFDWDKATLTDRARQIVAEAAANVAKVQTTRIQVNGYTDTSGSAKYNMGLSVRRAEAVAAELVRDGVLMTRKQVRRL
jgi:outer membrane protein OmpA-like peptidoglycan-associated protein